MFLEINQLTKHYGKYEAIDQLSFALTKGELLCILGPSGCGKSTVLKAIGGFIEAEGSIMLAGTELMALPPEERHVAMVFQSLGLFPHLSVSENIGYGLKFQSLTRQERQQKVIEMLETLDLSGLGERSIASLSGGQQQRVALGRALIVNPELLLLDEPLSSLDANLQQSMRQEIRHFQQAFGITTIFVTHNQAEAFEIADQIILMNAGQIVQQGTPKQLYQHPVNDFAREFIGQSSTLEQGYVRPEDITLGGGNIPATITRLVFKGTWTEVYLETAAGELMTLMQTPDELSVGEKIMIQMTRRDYENS
ncbi:MAG: ABC transporter ATP-binding protein [Aerococcus sp.]|nr:ABC transporter ATP-binding protein [Aerococcus sp.]